MNFNPLSPDAIDRTIIAEFYRDQNLYPLSQLSQFEGEGVYFIFADKLPYAHDNTKPIYIGKAVNRGGRKGLVAAKGTALFQRLKNHAASVAAANNLDIADFKFKYIRMEQVWIAYSESCFIRHFLPIWNTGYDGFGNKTPGKTRETQKLSAWDKAHPGRRESTIPLDKPETVDCEAGRGMVGLWVAAMAPEPPGGVKGV